LLNSIKLKGEKNYIIWKEVIEDIAVINKLRQYIYKKRKVLKYMNEFDEKANEIKLVVWQI